PNLDQKLIIKAWAAHVEDGIASVRNHRNLRDFLISL
ncbi:DndE family protein, partial [Escherichia coli]|nr:DndE family protein [Escherichia coli]